MLPVILLEPVSYSKRRRYSEILRDPVKWLQPDIDDVKQKLREIRSDTLDNLDSLVDEFRNHVAENPDIEVAFAADAGQAVDRIKEISGTSRIATNKSSVITMELVPLLSSGGFSVIDSYYDEFKQIDHVVGEHLQFPVMPFESRLRSFDRKADLLTLRSESIRENGTKEFIGLIGVNAVSAEDGTVVMLQHMSNIGKIFQHAREIILVAGLDKIVERQRMRYFSRNVWRFSALKRFLWQFAACRRKKAVSMYCHSMDRLFNLPRKYISFCWITVDVT